MGRRLVIVLLGVLVSLVVAPVALAQQDGEALHGTLTGPDGEPVVDVTITVSRDGEQVGEATTGDDGTWEVELPAAGEYDVELDTDTLPDGVVPRSPDRTTLENVSVDPGDRQIVIFPLVEPGEQERTGEPEPGSTPDATPPPSGRDGGTDWGALGTVLQRLALGIKIGALVAMMSIGLSLIFGTTGLINFAHGELVVFGAVVAYFFNASAVGPGLHLIPAAAAAVAVGSLLGGGMERGLWRPLRQRRTGRIQLFIISIGVSLLLRHVILLFFGSSPQNYADYTLQESVQLGPVAMTPRDLIIIAASVAVLTAVGLMLQLTRIGKAMRAVADNRDLAESSGIDVSRVLLLVWMLGSGLAALGGIMFGLSETITWNMGFLLLLLMFAAVILGGLGTAYGAMAGGFFVGIIAEMSTLYFPVELKNAWALGVLILVLLFRPQGIFGRRERVG